MQLPFSTTTTVLALVNLPVLINAHMMFAHKSVWGFGSVGGKLEEPLNRKSGGAWLHHGQTKDTDVFLELNPGESKSLNIVCGEAAKNVNKASSLCKTRADVHMGGGCAISIAYKNPNEEVEGEDFKIISVVHKCPTLGPFKHSFPIPENLPACEECTCAWHWVPNPKSSADEMYMNTFNCKVTGDNEGTIKDGRRPIYFGVEGGVKGSGSRPMYTQFDNGAQVLEIEN